MREERKKIGVRGFNGKIKGQGPQTGLAEAIKKRKKIRRERKREKKGNLCSLAIPKVSLHQGLLQGEIFFFIFYNSK